MKNKLCLSLVAAASGAFVLRRLGMRWGATDDEVHRPLPGDDLVPHPMLETTQHLEVGDTILDGPPGTAFFTVAA